MWIACLFFFRLLVFVESVPLNFYIFNLVCAILSYSKSSICMQLFSGTLLPLLLDHRIIISRFLQGSERSVACYCVPLMIHLQQVSLPQLGTYLDQPFVINSSNQKKFSLQLRSLSISICFAFRIDFKIRTTDELDGKRIKLQINMGYCWPRTITAGILQF